MQRNSDKFRERQRNVEKYREMQGNAENFREMQRCPRDLYDIHDTQKCHI